MTPEEAKTFQPKIVLLGEGNVIQKILPVESFACIEVLRTSMVEHQLFDKLISLAKLTNDIS